MQARKVRVVDIERLRQKMQNVPEHQAEEVTTTEAVRMLSPEIEAMQAKGYGLPAIAELLSDSGVAVTATTLKTYLGEARAAGGRKKRRKTKVLRPTGAVATTPTTESKPAVASAASGGGQPGARADTKAAPRVTTPTPSATPAAAKGTPGIARPADEAGIRRSAFVPKEDTRDI
jgi:hypothetical protein